MSRTKSETKSVTILRLGLSKATFLIGSFLLVLTMTALSWGEVHSFGNGPNFVIYPSAIVAGKGNQIKFKIISPEEDVQYDVLLKSQKIRLKNSDVFNLNIPFDNSFTYLTVKGIKDWSMSTATLLILSPHMSKVNTNKQLSIFLQPIKIPKNLYIFVNSSFGRESLKVFLNTNKVGDYQLSPTEDSAKMFEIPIENITNGIYEVKAQLSLITGQTITTATTLSYTLDKTPPKISNVDVTPKVVGPKGDLRISILATDQSAVRSVSINGVKATLKSGRWLVTLKKPFNKIAKSGYKILNLSIMVSDTFNNATTTSVSTDIFVDVNSPHCQVLPLKHTYVTPTTVKVKLWTDSGVTPIDVKILYDGSPAGTTIRIDRVGEHILAVSAINPVNGKIINDHYKFKVVKSEAPIPFWALVMFFVGTLVLLLFTLH